MEKIYRPSRQLRCTGRSLAPFLGQSLGLNTRELCVSLSFRWQLWAKHSSIDLHICNFEEVEATPIIFPLFFLFFLTLNSRNVGTVSINGGGKLITLLCFYFWHTASPFQEQGKRNRRRQTVKQWWTVRVNQIICWNPMDSLYIISTADVSGFYNPGKLRYIFMLTVSRIWYWFRACGY